MSSSSVEENMIMVSVDAFRSAIEFAQATTSSSTNDRHFVLGTRNRYYR